ncbi:MAG: hypothetical protein ACRCX2_36360 [Paraclostridium sp.]
MSNMLDIIKTIGLESQAVGSVGSEFEQDMVALESFVDLESTLNVSALETAMESIGYTQLAIAEAAGTEGEVFNRLSELGFVGTEAVVDVASRQWYKLKTVVKAFINTIINFFKKMLSLGNVTDKAMKAVKKKAESYEKRWGKESGYVKLDNDTDYKTAAKNLLIPFAAVDVLLGAPSGATVSGTDKTPVSLKEIFALINSVKSTTIKDFVTWVGANASDNGKIKKVVTEYDKADRTEGLSNFKETCADKLKDGSEVEELKASAYKTAVKTLLDTIKSTATSIESSKLSKDFDKSIKVFEKLRNDLNKIKEDEKDTVFGTAAGGGQDKWEEMSKFLSMTITLLTDAPKMYSVAIKTVISAANKGFTEVERCLSMR